MPLSGMKRKVKVEPLAVTLAQLALDSPAAQVTTPSKSPICITCSSRGPLEVMDCWPPKFCLSPRKPLRMMRIPKEPASTTGRPLGSWAKRVSD